VEFPIPLGVPKNPHILDLNGFVIAGIYDIYDPNLIRDGPLQLQCRN
jgi:hypothetical protein